MTTACPITPPPLPVSHRPFPILLAGPTAVGKSALALVLAEKLGGEIVSVDCMQVYRGLDIGTAKPTPEERRRVPHHLIDILDLTESFNAADFARCAHHAVQDIQSRGRRAILCGGTGLYFRAFLEGLGKAPPADPALRAELEARPLPELLRDLQQRDPVTFGRIDRQNPRRVVRALEVIRLTGQPFPTLRAPWQRQPSTLNPQPSTLDPRPSPPFFCLTRSPDDLRVRINARVEQMFARGLVAETERLLKQGLAENKTALQALGYRQVVELLRGERSLAQTIELVQARTRQFAKRQLTWFRHQAAVQWVHLAPAEDLREVAARLAAEIRA
jgi:tRNA dimethylallyltransferase